MIPLQVLRNPKVNLWAALAYGELLLASQDVDGFVVCRLSIRDLAKLLRCGTHTVSKALDDLEALGFLVRQTALKHSCKGRDLYLAIDRKCEFRTLPTVAPSATVVRRPAPQSLSRPAPQSLSRPAPQSLSRPAPQSTPDCSSQRDSTVAPSALVLSRPAPQSQYIGARGELNSAESKQNQADKSAAQQFAPCACGTEDSDASEAEGPEAEAVQLPTLQAKSPIPDPVPAAPCPDANAEASQAGDEVFAAALRLSVSEDYPAGREDLALEFSQTVSRLVAAGQPRSVIVALAIKAIDRKGFGTARGALSYFLGAIKNMQTEQVQAEAAILQGPILKAEPGANGNAKLTVGQARDADLKRQRDSMNCFYRSTPKEHTDGR